MSGARPTIWILEDDAEFRALLAELLRGPQVELRSFEAPQELLQALGEAPAPDVLVTDHHLDHLHGLDLVVGLRARGLALPVLLVTAFADAPLRAAAAAIPAVELIEKPCDVYALRRRVSQLLPGPVR